MTTQLIVRAQVWVPGEEEGDGDLYDGEVWVERSDDDEIALHFKAPYKDTANSAYLTLFNAGAVYAALKAVADDKD